MDNMEHVRLGLILAIQAEIDAMKLRNLQVGPEHANELGYSPEEFFKKAEELRNTCFAHINQLLGL